MTNESERSWCDHSVIIIPDGLYAASPTDLTESLTLVPVARKETSNLKLQSEYVYTRDSAELAVFLSVHSTWCLEVEF